MSAAPLPLWQTPPPDLIPRLTAAVDAGLARAAGPVTVFFRDDDCGLPGTVFSRLLALFIRHHLPLALAVVPAWLPLRSRQFLAALEPAGALASLHMHGYRHANHETTGKKQEFGPGRGRAEKARDLARGRDLLVRHLGSRLRPVFTPPWNRCDAETLALLPGLGCSVVSRFAGAPPPPPGLVAADVNVDLHTQRQADPETAAARLCADLEASLASGRVGLMLHHARMNETAFAALDTLLALLAAHPAVRPAQLEEAAA